MVDPAIGPSSDFGWATCHGCEKDSDRWGDPSEKHRDGCHGSCTRVGCSYHNQNLRIHDAVEDLVNTLHDINHDGRHHGNDCPVCVDITQVITNDILNP